MTSLFVIVIENIIAAETSPSIRKKPSLGRHIICSFPQIKGFMIFLIDALALMFDSRIKILMYLLKVMET